MNHRFRLVGYSEASDSVKAIYEETMREMGLPFVLNWFKCQGSVPLLLEGNWAKLRSTMLRGEVPFILKQLIIYNISRKKGCRYCTHAHGVTVDSMSKTLTGRDDLRLTEHMESDYVPSAYRIAVQIVTASALNPQATTDQDFDSLREEGFTEPEISELMALADLTNMLNTIADISGIPIDNELMEAV